MKRIAKIIIKIFVVLILIIIGLILYSYVGYKKSWSIALPNIVAVKDSAAIARGKYLVYGPAHCVDCHALEMGDTRLSMGERLPLTGGKGETTYLGDWAAPNLTPDPLTGLGRVSDGQIARMIRHGVNREGQIALPFMDAYANLSNYDLISIISFLRSVPAKPGIPPTKKVNILGKIALTYFIKPYAPISKPNENYIPQPTIKYGSYIANTVAGCRSCHTDRNLKTGEFLGPFFSGGLSFNSRHFPGYVYVSPNLTPDDSTGHITLWSEEQFIKRFRDGFNIPDSPMPWAYYGHMTETDLKALYRYLQALPPFYKKTGQIKQIKSGDAAGEFSTTKQ